MVASSFVSVLCFLVVAAVLPSTIYGAYTFKSEASLKGAEYFQIVQADAPFYLTYTLTAQQDVKGFNKTFSVLLLDTMNLQRLANGTYYEAEYFLEASGEAVTTKSIMDYYVEYGETGPTYYLVIVNDNLLSPVRVQYDVIATPSKLSTELEAAVAVIAMLCFFCCCFGAFYCMRSGKLQHFRQKMPMRFKAIRRAKRPERYEDMEDEHSVVPLEETERS